MIVRLCGAFICAILLIAACAPYDPWVQYYVGKQFKDAFSRAMNCSIEGRVRSVNIIFPSLILENVKVKSCNDKEWQWSCKEYSTGFSWLNLLKTKMINMWIQITDMHIYSKTTDTDIHILEHVSRFIGGAPPTLPIALSECIIRKCMIEIEESKGAYHGFLHFSGHAKNIHDSIKSRWYITESKGIYKQETIWDSSAGSLVCDIEKNSDNSPRIIIKTDITTTLAGCERKRKCFISGTWNNNQGKISVHSDDNSITCDPCIIRKNNEGWFIKCFGRSTLQEIIWLLTEKTLDTQGDCIFSISGPLKSSENLNISLTLDHCGLRNSPLTGTIKTHAILNNFSLKGSCLGSLSGYTSIEGAWNYDLNARTGSFSLFNNSNIFCDYIDRWHIKPHDFSLKGSIHPTDSLLTYKTIVSHKTVSKVHTLKGTIAYQDTIATVNGKKDDTESYHAQFSLLNYPYLTSFEYIHDGSSWCTGHQQPKGISLDCNLLLVRTLLATCFDKDIQAEGNIHIECSFDHTHFNTLCRLDNGIIRLPQTYNFISGGTIDCSYHWLSKIIDIHAVKGTMHCGSFYIKNGVIACDNHYKPTFMHIPLIFNRCLFNMKRDLFVMLSGHLLCEQKNKTPLIAGSVIIERGQIKENIFSQDFQKQIGLFSTNIFNLSSPLIQTDILLHSRNDIKIDTPFLKTTAKVALHFTDSITKPIITGAVTLTSGLLQFPYRPLEINRGIISFEADKGYNPSVELLARNQVRNHRITLHATGTLLDHHIELSSNPPLTDEQVIGLLLAGSSEESLKNMMPALIMNNLKNLVFGSNQLNFLNKYFFKPLGNAVSINLIPSFTDQSGRGGLRGALEINVNDRWRGLIQKNFNFTEDTRFELEYLFADNMSFRAVRDEQKNISLETEMRWKF